MISQNLAKTFRCLIAEGSAILLGSYAAVLVCVLGLHLDCGFSNPW